MYTRSRLAVGKAMLIVAGCLLLLTHIGTTQADAIVGGEAAATGEYPWMVKLPDCSGTLIAPDWVLTATHCMVPGQSNAVWIGGRRWGEGERRYWNRSVELAPFATGDQTLLHLSSPSTKTPLAYNATAAFGTVGPVRAIGYGESCPTCSDAMLRSVSNLPAVDSGNGFITSGRAGSNRSICMGDSGGPLVKNHNGQWLQVAVHSYTIRPNCTGLGGHTATAQFASEIERITGVAPKRPRPPGADSQRPSAPRGLTLGTDNRTLRWDASTDNVGVAHYLVFRSTDGSVGPQIAQTLNTSYRDTSAQPGRRYTYTVKARDAAGNMSWRSNLVQTQAGAAVSCTKRATNAGVEITVEGMTADRFAVRSNGRWIASLDGATERYVHRGGNVDNSYVVRYYKPSRIDLTCTR